MPAVIQPFRVEVPDDDIRDLRDRLGRTRWPGPAPDHGWGYGTELGYLQELCDYWRDGFDWRAAEAGLNRWPQFTTAIGAQRLHFVHARSPEPDAFPLVITHGWPGSVAEFAGIIGPLSDPRAHGGDPADAFHVICPSMPGYGFSGPTADPGWDIRRVASANCSLMEQLGYRRWGAAGGDWGAIATTWMGLMAPAGLAGIHVNMVVAGPPERPDAMELVRPEEMEYLAATMHFQEHETGYQRIQGTKPQTLTYGLHDSPAGLAGWIVEKFRTWSDCDGDVERRFTKDQLLTNIGIYWFTGTIGSSVRLYCESMRSGLFGAARQRVEVPTGCAVFPKEIYRAPRAWADAAYNVRRWSVMGSGGHFAAMEEPAAYVDDVRAFFRDVR